MTRLIAYDVILCNRRGAFWREGWTDSWSDLKASRRFFMLSAGHK